ncbi:hypothetical protein CYLTODRAFT_423899 [Cylindrobasidium torrendii FP15055 ss-10]|uniref:Zn(2)-C6 fungal-type domain-containing protein n=1 Tax=Cylindrobasidium torrendii FP15055 ss-10 TaxID=1314674 RepID=A0A0D7B5T1_9AGAR|nr:hypothetical protein CYLTODRAFT_423899 [Cylindrobasidium torrendii FP15055 ss-10]
MDNNAPPEPPCSDIIVLDQDDPTRQLKIPIPKTSGANARQSSWVGHRGKLRCDQCRIHNLKCDRIQPSCNQCSWIPGSECKYTPLPTPAHRGVPRCDSCRAKNLKCDRNLPICDQCEHSPNAHCVYSPKRRKRANGRGGSGIGEESDSDSSEAPRAVAQSVIIPKPTKTHQAQNLINTKPAQQAAQLATPYQSPSSMSFTMKHHQQGLYTATAPNRPFRRIQPWAHPGFLPLPSNVLLGIAGINAAEMPPRIVFEQSLDDFIGHLLPHVQETACMSLDSYVQTVKYLAGRPGINLPHHLKRWLGLHHCRAGSSKYSLLLLPRDRTFGLEPQEEERYLDHFRLHADRRALESDHSGDDATKLHWWNAYEIVPVRSQMYDIMVYAHRKHGGARDMLDEISKLGIANVTWPMIEIFYQKCPYCANMAQSHPQTRTSAHQMAPGPTQHHSMPPPHYGGAAHIVPQRSQQIIPQQAAPPRRHQPAMPPLPRAPQPVIPQQATPQPVIPQPATSLHGQTQPIAAQQKAAALQKATMEHKATPSHIPQQHPPQPIIPQQASVPHQISIVHAPAVSQGPPSARMDES